MPQLGRLSISHSKHWLLALVTALERMRGKLCAVSKLKKVKILSDLALPVPKAFC